MYYVAHHSHRWIYEEGTFVGGSSGTTSLSSYSLMGIVLERDPISIIDLLDSETIEGLVAQGVELGVLIEEVFSEPESDVGLVPEPESDIGRC